MVYVHNIFLDYVLQNRQWIRLHFHHSQDFSRLESCSDIAWELFYLFKDKISNGLFPNQFIHYLMNGAK